MEQRAPWTPPNPPIVARRQITHDMLRQPTIRRDNRPAPPSPQFYENTPRRQMQLGPVHPYQTWPDQTNAGRMTRNPTQDTNPYMHSHPELRQHYARAYNIHPMEYQNPAYIVRREPPMAQHSQSIRYGHPMDAFDPYHGETRTRTYRGVQGQQIPPPQGWRYAIPKYAEDPSPERLPAPSRRTLRMRDYSEEEQIDSHFGPNEDHPWENQAYPARQTPHHETVPTH